MASADGAPRTRGSTVQSTMAFVQQQYGAAVAGAIEAALAPPDRDRLRVVTPTDEVPYGMLVRLWQAADTVLKGHADAGATWAEQAGAESIGSYGVQLYGGILRKPTPREFLTQSISLFRLYYQPGDMEVVEDSAGRAVLRLVGFDPVTPLFCRRLSGGLHRAIAFAGGEQATVRHVRCALEGDAFCEWALSWQPASPPEDAPAGARRAP
jgi:hypothetical protein